MKPELRIIEGGKDRPQPAGASHSFLNMTRNTDLARRAIERRWVIERTPKAAGDVVI